MIKVPIFNFGSISLVKLTMNLKNDAQLLNLIRQDDQRAFKALYERHWHGLYKKAFQRLHDEASAENMVQEVFVNLYVKRHELRADSSVKAYLYRVLKNKVIDEIRKRLHQKVYEESFINFQSDVSQDLQLELEARELQRQVAVFASTLPEKCHEVFKLKQAELPNKQIAKQLAISEKTVEGHISRARRLMKLYFAHYFMLFIALLPFFYFFSIFFNR